LGSQDNFTVSRVLVVEHGGDKFPMAIELVAQPEGDRERAPRVFRAFRVLGWPATWNAAIAWPGRGICGEGGDWEATRAY
jgi:hypothetical protein